MVILQSHRTQNMILRCYPNVSAILRRHTHLVSCAFSTIPIFSPFNSQNFFLLVYMSFSILILSVSYIHVYIAYKALCKCNHINYTRCTLTLFYGNMQYAKFHLSRRHFLVFPVFRPSVAFSIDSWLGYQGMGSSHR